MAPLTLPKKPVENWEQVRDEWVAAVEQLVGDAEGWARTQGWATRREPKAMTEDRLGQYAAPRLLIHSPDGRLLLDPIARYVPGALGVVEFCVLPSYDAMRIARSDEGWRLYSDRAADVSRPWSEPVFLETARQLFESGR
jgi:hypothetical protein